MKSYLFQEIGNKFLAVEPLNSIFADSDASSEKVRSTDLTFSESECLELQDDEQIIAVQKTQNIIDAYNLSTNKLHKIQALNEDFNLSEKITIQNGKTLIIEHDTPERNKFLALMEDVSTLSTTEDTAFIYKQQTISGTLALRILPEIAAYIFKDLFVATLRNPQKTKVKSRVHNETTVYELAVEKINKATTQAELDAVTWSFINPTGIVIDVNDKATQMLADSNVSDVAKAAINAAKDPATGEIHLVKTLEELAADS